LAVRINLLSRHIDHQLLAAEEGCGPMGSVPLRLVYLIARLNEGRPLSPIDENSHCNTCPGGSNIADPAFRRESWTMAFRVICPSTHPTAAGLVIRLAYRQARAAGIELAPILRRTHLTPAQIDDPTTRFRVRDQILFINLVADALHDDLLGFHLAQLPDLREIGWLYYVAASAKTLGEALGRLARYTRITNEGAVVRYTSNSEIKLRMHYVGVSRHLDRHQMEFFATILVRLCRELSGHRVTPIRMRFVHPRKTVPSAFIGFFGSDTAFGAASDQIVFPGSIGEMRVASADPYLHNLVIMHLEECLGQRGAHRGSFRSRVENEIVQVLPHGRPRAEELARRLGTSQRTFARRLADEGYSFSEVLEQLRFDLAKRHLADRDLSISEIAWLLGYREASAFTHAFKRWTGKTPQQTRRRSIRKATFRASI
jgi:AraC-like DNA-binding protein